MLKVNGCVVSFARTSFYSDRLVSGRNVFSVCFVLFFSYGVRVAVLSFISSSDVCGFMTCWWNPLHPTCCVRRKGDGQVMPE